MSSSSIAATSSAPAPYPQLDNSLCTRQLEILSASEPTGAISTPLNRCRRLIRGEYIDTATHPLHSIAVENMPVLTVECKNILKERLTIPIRVGSSTVRPIDWIIRIWNKLQGKPWFDCRDALIAGSGLPLTRDYWQAYLEQFPNLEPGLKGELCSVLSSTGDACSNIDAFLCGSLECPEVREKFETLIIKALFKSLNPRMETTTQLYKEAIATTCPTLKGPTKIGDLCSVYTIGKEVTFDLTVWYQWPRLPWLYSQQDAFVSFFEFIGNKSLFDGRTEDWPKMSLTHGETSPSQLLVDRALNILRLNQENQFGAGGNIGLLKKYFIMMTKGNLGVQKGLLQWAYEIYLPERKDPKTVARDVYKSYKEHLPQTLSTLLAHTLHWMASVPEMIDALKEELSNAKPEDKREIERRKILLNSSLIELGRLLTFPMTQDQPVFLKQIYAYLQKYPQRFPMLINVIEFVMLLEYLKNHEQTVTCGLWEGELKFRFSFDGSCSSYFQRPVTPNQTLEKMLSFFSRAPMTAPEAKEAAKAILFAMMEHFKLHEGFPYSKESLELLEANGLDKKLLLDVLKLLKEAKDPSPARKVDQTELLESVAAQTSEVHVVKSKCVRSNPLPVSRRIPELIEDRDWSTVAQRLLKIGRKSIPQEKFKKLGEFVWLLFKEWSVQWRIKKPSNEEKRMLPFLLEAFVEPLLATKSEDRTDCLRNLLSCGFDDLSLLQFLQQHEVSTHKLFLECDLELLLAPKIQICFDSTLLAEYHKLIPNPVQKHVLDCINLRPLPPKDRLTGLVAYLKDQTPEQWEILQAELAVQLTRELRFGELKSYACNVNVMEILSRLFDEALEKFQFSRGRILLKELRSETKSLFDHKEFQLLEREAVVSPASLTLENAVELWQRELKGQEPDVAERALALCLHLIRLPMKIEKRVMTRFWSLITEGDQISRLVAFSGEQWRILFANMQNSKNYYELLQGLTCYLHIHHKKWDHDFESFAKEIFTWNLRQGNQAKYNELRASSLLYVLGVMVKTGQIEWVSQLHPRNGLAILAIKNSIELTKKHPFPKDQKVAWNLGREILSKLRGKSLPVNDHDTLKKVELDLSACGRSVEFMPPLEPTGDLPQKNWFNTVAQIIALIGTLLFLYKHVVMYLEQSSAAPPPLPEPPVPPSPYQPTYFRRAPEPTPIEAYTMREENELGTFMCIPGDIKRCKPVCLYRT